MMGSIFWKKTALHLDVRYYGMGRPVYGKLKVDTAESRAKLESAARDYLAEIDRNYHSGKLFDSQLNRYPTFRQMAEFFWAEYWVKRPYFERGFADPQCDRAKLDHCIEFLGRKRADEIKRSTVKDYRMHLREIGEPRNWSNSYINRMIAMVGQVYRFAITQEVYRSTRASARLKQLYGCIELVADLDNPAHGLPRLPETPKETMTVTLEQFRLLWDIMDGEYRHYALIAAHTGFRKRNVLRLQIDEVDMLNRTFRLHDHKGKRPLVHMMHPDLVGMFEALEPFDDEYWFSGRFSYRRWDQYTASVGLAGFEPFRGMRRSYVTWRAEEGASLSLLEALLGHSSPAITQRHYNRAYDASKSVVPQQRSVVNG